MSLIPLARKSLAITFNGILNDVYSGAHYCLDKKHLLLPIFISPVSAEQTVLMSHYGHKKPRPTKEQRRPMGGSRDLTIERRRYRNQRHSK